MSKHKPPPQQDSKPIHEEMLDLYTDYLINSFGFTTAAGMSTALDGAVSHAHVTRFLSERLYTNTDLWKLVKPTIRQMETDDGVLVVDDTIEEKLQGIFHAVESLTWEETTTKTGYLRGMVYAGAYHPSRLQKRRW